MTAPQSDTSTLAFKIRTHIAEYGDGAHFAEWRILMCQDGKVVGFEKGPRRTHATRADAMKMARARIAVLKTRRLFVINVTKQNIRDGEARSCNSCAVAQALWDNQERMGFAKRQFNFRVEPYGFMTDVRGIVLERHWDSEPPLMLEEMPDLVTQSGNHKEGHCTDTMLEWTMHWDDWASSLGRVREWKKETGNDYTPYRPSAASFVLDLDAFKQEADEPLEEAA